MAMAKTGLLVSFFLLLLTSCGREPADLVISGEALGTSYLVRIARFDGQAPPDRFAGRVAEVLDDLDHKLSTYKADSELNRLNRHPLNEPFLAGDDLYRVLEISQEIHRLSGGAFDPTLGPLVDLWGFGPVATEDRVPDDAEIEDLLGRVGFHRVELIPPNQVIRRSDLSLDLSAVAKGFIVDRVAAALRAMGATDFMVEIGGEIRVDGYRRDGAPWRIAIELPRPEGGIEQVLGVTDVGMATSGDYRNYFERDGKRYSHLLDPRTGRPITHRLASVTVLAEAAADADALATALMVMGPEEGARWSEDHELAVLMLVKSGEGFREVASSRMLPYLQSLPEGSPSDGSREATK